MKYRRTLSLLQILLITFSGLFATIAYAEEAKKEQAPAAAEKSKPSATIVRGMPEAEVLKLLGEPDSKRRQKASDGSFVEFWNYRRIVGQTEKYQVTGVEMTEVWSPSIGDWIEVPEEIEELVTTTITQTVEIVMHKGKVLTFKADLEQDMDVQD